MTLQLDPRLAARRRQVRESWARRRLRWIIALLVVILIGGVGWALTQSPWLAVRTVSVHGVTNAAATEILEEHGVEPGTPTVAIRSDAIEVALLRDPWVSRAEVRVTWPGSVEVTVLERRAAAWVHGRAGWSLVADDGFVLAAGEPQDGDPVLEAVVGAIGPGDRIFEDDIVGAIEFLGLLPADLAHGATAHVAGTGIEAVVRGHEVLLGNRRDMPEKVATLTAMLGDDLPPGAVLNVISPLRPGILNPEPLVEDTSEEVSSSDDSG